MTQQGRWPRRLRGPLLALTLLAGPGCLSFLHPIDAVSHEQAAPSTVLPQGCRNHVHVFFIHGLDPLDFANLNGVCEYVHSLGYLKTHYGQLYHIWQFKKELRQVHEEDPEARFVLVGFSFGANMVRSLANAAKEANVPIDLLIYLGGNTLENTPEDQPDNVLRIYNILATGWIWNGAVMDRAENLNYTNVWHFGSPSHPETLRVLAEELPVVASRVPLIEPQLSPWPDEEAPTPRPVMPRADGPRDEWDFLKPTLVYEEPLTPTEPSAANKWTATAGPYHNKSR